MFLKLRVICTILSALCLAFALTAWAVWGPIWLAILGLGALLFYLLMRVFKQYQEAEEEKLNNPQPSFLTPADQVEKSTDTQEEEIK